jgi:hypothetical protein
VNYRPLLAKLKALPAERRKQLVVRSMPFGDIIEDDTGRVHGRVEKIDGGPERTFGNGGWWAAGHDWRFVAYGLCRAAKGETVYEEALREAGYLA